MSSYLKLLHLGVLFQILHKTNTVILFIVLQQLDQYKLMPVKQHRVNMYAVAIVTPTSVFVIRATYLMMMGLLAQVI